MDANCMSANSDVEYRCPGERHPIDRAIHLGRLAVFYPDCRICPHRDDTGVLSPLQVKQLAEVGPRYQDRALHSAEGIAGVFYNQLTPRAARRFATAVGVVLREGAAPNAEAPAIMLAGDGRPLTAELVAAASEGLRTAGCQVRDVGAVTSGCLARAISHFHADAGLYVGNLPGQPHTASLRVWGRAACPWSAPGRLAAVQAIVERGIDRPVRSYGSLQRSAFDDLYLAELQPTFHALRPLSIVVDTSSAPLIKNLEELLHHSACRILRPREPESFSQVGSRPDGKNRKETPSFQEHRLERVCQAVCSERAHFGIWIDGDGEALHLVDERGKVVDPERSLVMVARNMLSALPGSAIVVASETSPQVVDELIAFGAQVSSAGSTGEAIVEAMAARGAILAGGPGGRLFLGGDPLAADALRVLSLLLPLLSQTDRPLSVVVHQG